MFVSQCFLQNQFIFFCFFFYVIDISFIKNITQIIVMLMFFFFVNFWHFSKQYNKIKCKDNKKDTVFGGTKKRLYFNCTVTTAWILKYTFFTNRSLFHHKNIIAFRGSALQRKILFLFTFFHISNRFAF